MHSSPDVVVVGGGVIGCATAYFLSKHGLRCLLLEPDGIGSKASGNAAGELSPLNRSGQLDKLSDFSVHSLKLHRELSIQLTEESGIDYHLASTPTFRPAFNFEELERQELTFRSYHEIGISAKLLDQSTLNQMGTYLPDKTLGAVYTEFELQLEAHLFTQALAESAKRSGTMVESRKLTGLAVKGESLAGLYTNDGYIDARIVILAIGPWTNQITELLGFPVPIIPLKGQILQLAGELPPLGYGIMHQTGYILPKPSGIVYLGTTEEEVGFCARPTIEGQTSILEAINALAPKLDTSKIIRGTACLRPLSTDGLPLIGPIPGVNGAFLATGHGRKGILQSLATGQSLAQLVIGGVSEFPLDPFLPERFAQ